MAEFRFVRVLFAVAMVLAIVVLFGPMIFIPTIVDLMRAGDLSPAGAAEATVGVGVILRAAVRRLLRSGARNVMQTTVGTFARTSVRAATRRVVRVAAKTSLLLFRPDAAESNEDHDSEQRPAAPGSLSSSD